MPVYAQLAGLAHGAPDEAAEHIGLVNIARAYAIGHHEGGSANVFDDNAFGIAAQGGGGG